MTISKMKFIIEKYKLFLQLWYQQVEQIQREYFLDLSVAF